MKATTRLNWTSPRRFSQDNPYARVSHYVLNGAGMGSVVWFGPEGPYYGMTQTRRLGPYSKASDAYEMVETHAVSDVVNVQTVGSA